MTTPFVPFKARTKVSWPGEEEGDLGFMENEVVHVLAVVDESWWTGKLKRNGREGIFPKDYVEILEEKPQSSAASSFSTPTRNINAQENEVKVKVYNQSPYNNAEVYSSSKVKKSNKKSHPNVPHDYDYSYDSSLDNIAERHSRSKTPTPSKLKRMSADFMEPSPFKYKFKEDLVDEDITRKMNELDYLKFLKFQNQSKSSKNSVMRASKSSFLSQDKSHPNSPPKKKGNNFIKSNQYELTPSFGAAGSNTKLKYLQAGIERSRAEKDIFTSQSHEDVYNTSPSWVARHGFRSEDHLVGRYDDENSQEDITFKRRQLELELEKLKELEKHTYRMKASDGYPKLDRREIDQTYDSDYVSEDLISSKKYFHDSREELGRNLGSFESDEDNSESPPPPPPPKRSGIFKRLDEFPEGEMENVYLKKPLRKKSYDADQFQASGVSEKGIVLSGEDIMMLSQMPSEDLKNSIKSLQSDVLNLSELSATSAGSFIRHKIDREQSLQESKLKGLSLNGEHRNSLSNGMNEKDSSKDVIENIFQDKNARHPNIFKKLLQKRREGENVNLIEKKLINEPQMDWTTFKTGLNRMNTLTSSDKQARTRRVVRQDGSLIVKPLDFVTEINADEVLGEIDPTDRGLDFSNLSFERVDSLMDRYKISNDLNEMISDISVKFHSSVLDQIRAVLIHLCKFKIIEESGKICSERPKLREILTSGQGKIFQINYLFKKILSALGIQSEIVHGLCKKPSEFYREEHYVINHCWLSILVQNHFAVMDIYLFKNGHACNLRNSPNGFNEYYFLTKPSKVISTHIPSIISMQHVLPPIDQNVAFYLPRIYSGFYRSHLKFMDFNNALSKLRDLEFFELDLEVPINVEIFTLIKTANITTNEASLCQMKWEGSRRIAKIKAILPHQESIGILQIFAGPKGLQKHFDNVHELAIVIPLSHEGISKESKFIPRFPTIQSQNNDLYIKQPQVSKIIVKNSYNFEIYQFPSGGQSKANQDFKIVIESPSGKYFKLNKEDPFDPSGLYEANIKCQEVGLYRGLVIGDTGNSWYVFTQWDCVAGTVQN